MERPTEFFHLVLEKMYESWKLFTLENCSTAPANQQIVASLSSGEVNHDKPITNADSKAPSVGERSRAAAEWDPSFETENVDWYSEYIARHGPVSFSWLHPPRIREATTGPESCNVKGIGLLRDWSSAREDKVIAPLEDGTVCIWDFNFSH